MPKRTKVRDRAASAAAAIGRERLAGGGKRKSPGDDQVPPPAAKKGKGGPANDTVPPPDVDVVFTGGSGEGEGGPSVESASSTKPKNKSKPGKVPRKKGPKPAVVSISAVRMLDVVRFSKRKATFIASRLRKLVDDAEAELEAKKSAGKGKQAKNVAGGGKPDSKNESGLTTEVLLSFKGTLDSIARRLDKLEEAKPSSPTPAESQG